MSPGMVVSAINCNVFTPVTFTLMLIAALAPVSVPLSKSRTPSPKTWKWIDPWPLTSSSMPMSDRNVLYWPLRL